MTMQDPIADLLTRIRNAQQANHPEVEMPASKIKVAICKVLEQEGFIEGYEVTEGAKPTMNVRLRYHRGQPVIEEIKRSSRPGLRNYKGSEGLPKVRGGFGDKIFAAADLGDVLHGLDAQLLLGCRAFGHETIGDADGENGYVQRFEHGQKLTLAEPALVIEAVGKQ